MLRLSKKTWLALEAVVDVAINARPDPVQSKEITARQGIPQRYLEQVMQQLVRAGILKGVRGPRGGYRLARPASDIRIVEVLAAVDETVDAMHKGAGASGGSSGSRAQSLTNRLWQGLSAHVYVFLHQTRLSDVVTNERPWLSRRGCREENEAAARHVALGRHCELDAQRHVRAGSGCRHEQEHGVGSCDSTRAEFT